MASEAKTIDVADVGDLGSLVEEIRRSRIPRILRRDGEDVAVLMPLTRGTQRAGGRLRPPTASEVARSQAGIREAAGSWRDIDAETLKDTLRRQRDIVTRPPAQV